MEKNDRYIDDLGFVRKPRNWLGLFGFFFYYALINSINLRDLFDILVLLIAATLFYLGIAAVSSHEIETWKHSTYIQTYIFLACIFWGIPGIILYYYFIVFNATFLT